MKYFMIKCLELSIQSKLTSRKKKNVEILLLNDFQNRVQKKSMCTY